MRVELSGDPGDFRARDWTPLVEADPEGTWFHTPQFLKTWWEEFHADAELRLAFVDDGRETVAEGAFELRDGQLSFLGGFDVTDYLGPVGLPGAEGSVSAALAGAIGELEWERADLAGLPADGRWLPALRTALDAAGLRPEEGDDGVAPVIELPGTYAAYESSLPPKLRHEIRRKARKLEREAGSYRLVETDRETLEEHLDRFIALHRSSQGPKGKFLHAGMELFFRHLADDFLDPGPFRLTFVEAAGELMAGAISFRFKETVHLYNSAFDDAFAPLAPGMVLVGELIRSAIEDGCRRFDLLKGDLGYKYRFGARPRPIRRLRLSR